MAPKPWDLKDSGPEKNTSPRMPNAQTTHRTPNRQGPVYERYDTYKPFSSLSPMPKGRSSISDGGKWILAPSGSCSSVTDTPSAVAERPSGQNLRTQRILPRQMDVQMTSGQPHGHSGDIRQTAMQRPGSIESLGLQPPNLGIQEVSLEVDVEVVDGDTDGVGHVPRKRRPTAPKPRARKRSSVILGQRESLLGQHGLPIESSMGGSGPINLLAPAPTREDISISPNVNAAWKESWVLSSARHSADKLGNAKEDLTSVTDSMQLFANYKESETQQNIDANKHPEREVTVTHKGKSSETSIPKKLHQLPRHHRKGSIDRKASPTSTLQEKSSLEKKRGRRRTSKGEPLTGTEAHRTSMDETSTDQQKRMSINPSKELLPSASRGFVPTTSSQDRDKSPEGQKLPMSKYCPWHPRPIYNAWMSHKADVPSWLNVETGSQFTSKSSKPPQSDLGSNVSELPSCCELVEQEVAKEVRPPQRKPQRPEVVRWLLGYPVHTRFFRETCDLKKNPIPGVVVEVDETNPRRLLVHMEGPVESSYEGGVFQFEVFFPGLYPKEAPKIRFMTKIFHPNIDKLGRVRMPMIEEKWAPSTLVRQVFESVQDILATPNLSDPLAVDVARRWFWHEPSAKQTARVWTKRFAHAHTPIVASVDCNCKCFCEHQSTGCPLW